MPFTLMKSADSPHIAAAEGAMEFHRQDSRSQMGQHAEQYDDDHDDAEKARHPITGSFTSGQIPSGASHSPITNALARHPGPAPLASLATTPTVSLGSSIAPGSVELSQFDYRTNGTQRPIASPLRPDFHTASNTPR